MKQRLNYKLKYLIFASCCLVALSVLAGFASSRQAEKTCEKVTIKIGNEYNNYFISDEEVTALLSREGTQQLQGENADQINLKDLETRLVAHPFVKEAQVYRELEGNVNVYIKQNRPIARIIHANQDVYLSETGELLPLSDHYTARVLVISRPSGLPAFKEDFFKSAEGKNYMDLLHRIYKEPFWKAQLSQMLIDGKGKVTFLPQVGEQTIEFGKPIEVEDKFKKLLVFYRKVMPKMGWNRYQKVNVEYHDQIVCE